MCSVGKTRQSRCSRNKFLMLSLPSEHDIEVGLLNICSHPSVARLKEKGLRALESIDRPRSGSTSIVRALQRYENARVKLS